ncbi:translation initiation factor [Sphingobacterium pedocola]|uniref:Translation initiation factor n=1 Tax=Sphingobacterium pedocola TaxID=2082722 RepID=A0ABR9TC37_9SPHI|nr:translation initiation factor [Sphingobacterium pedocola]MBE8722911.1 translation initiation factor [Sphingobacterium pedocola]
MAKQKKQRYDGVVYSTADDFDYRNSEETLDQETLPNEKQRLRVLLDKKARKGKVVTLVEGFSGKEEDLADLAKTLKQKCGVGGSAKDGEILIQGDFKQKIFDILLQMGYKAKCIG